LQVKQISSKDTHSIRSQMLRPGRPIDECIYSGDEDDPTFHLGAFVEQKLVSVASFYFEKNQNIPDEYQFRLRGMATLTNFQKLGLSKALLEMAFPIIKQNLCYLLWCNARVGALGFYEKVGFEKISDEFEIEHIGPHYLLSKNIEK
jgi:GNAT superfamily N-acetyltransferase